MRSDEELTLQSLTARPLLQLLEELVCIRELWGSGAVGALPLATFHLRSGRDICGWLLSINVGKGGERSLLVQRFEPGRAPALAAVYVDLSALEAVTLDAPAAFASHLSNGTVPPPLAALPAGDGVTRLQLRRTLQLHSEALTTSLGTPLELTAAWENLPTEPRLLGPLAALAADLLEVLNLIAASTIGQTALVDLRQIVLVSGKKGVERSGQVLRVRVQPELGRMGTFSRAELQIEIERVL